MFNRPNNQITLSFFSEGVYPTQIICRKMYTACLHDIISWHFGRSPLFRGVRRKLTTTKLVLEMDHPQFLNQIFHLLCATFSFYITMKVCFSFLESFIFSSILFGNIPLSRVIVVNGIWKALKACITALTLRGVYGTCHKL